MSGFPPRILPPLWGCIVYRIKDDAVSETGLICGHLLGGEDLVIRWYARVSDAATLLKGATALAALVALVVGVGADWRWD